MPPNHLTSSSTNIVPFLDLRHPTWPIYVCNSHLILEMLAGRNLPRSSSSIFCQKQDCHQPYTRSDMALSS